jgi:anti-sigma factor ChrR (cupin superfamily)
MTEKRAVVDAAAAAWRPYDRYGAPIEKLSWIPLSEDAAQDRATFLLRFDPSGRSMPHEHTGIEEFYVLEGTLIDDDGTAFGPGTFVRFDPGSTHSSHAPDGCVILVTLLGRNRPLAAAG